MRILLLDIETAPHNAYAWGLWGQDIHPDQIVKAGYTLSWSAKWFGEKEVFFNSVHQSSYTDMLKEIHALLDEADIVVHYNGKRFDIPTLNKEFIIHKMRRPKAFKHLDLLTVSRSTFRFPHNKLDSVCQTLGIGKKVRHKGMQLWNQCMEGNHRAWIVMEKYNKQDVILLEKLYRRYLPWIPNHPRLCSKCGIWYTGEPIKKTTRCEHTSL